ncbi:DUF4221 family protein [Algoriphagus algorifonticola]|uniref:DUF4221 family protein n=1 Tax=Algoriphagus algorifonticola TaxID=2593007 RepID=UPI0011A3E60B|nr:DUF4221 family protein [Algoriphagus algorifonticola]
MKKLILFFGLLSLLFGCNSAEKSESKSKIQLTITDTIKTFELPVGVGHFNHAFQTVEDRYVLFFDYKSFQIITYSKEDGSLIQTVQLEKEGPNGVGKNVLGFFAKSLDEIYLTAGSNTLYKMNGKGEILQKFQMDTEELEKDGISLFSNIFTIANDGIYFAAFPMVFEWTSLSPEELTTMPNLLKFDSLSNSFTPVSYFPAEFVGTNLNKAIFPLLSLGPDQEPVINLNFRNLYQVKNGKIQAHLAAHSEFPEEPTTSSMPNMFEDMNEIMKMINNVDIYTDLFYLPEQELLVRVAKFEDIPESTADATFLASQWGLVFLDTDYKKIGEITLEPNQYNGQYIFGTNEGIWISTDHPENPELSEDFMRFQLIEVNR